MDELALVMDMLEDEVGPEPETRMEDVWNTDDELEELGVPTARGPDEGELSAVNVSSDPAHGTYAISPTSTYLRSLSHSGTHIITSQG